MNNQNIAATADLLKAGCEKLNLNLTGQQYEQLIQYIQLLVKWNTVYNLTSITDPQAIVIKHILDCLSVVQCLSADLHNIIDIGSGGGLPGVILAIVKPDLQVSLLDSNNKKTAFLQQVKIQLKLNNIEIINQRVEKYIPQKLFDAIISRAFASLVDYTNLVEHLLTPSGIIYAMKAKFSAVESSEFNKQADKFVIIENKKLEVPYLSDDRCLITIARVRTELDK